MPTTRIVRHTSHRRLGARRSATAAAAALLLLAACSEPADDPLAPAAAARPQPSFGLVRTTWPSGDDPGVPAYARIEPVPPHVYSDGELAAIVFYRDPACIPADFNLLTFFGAPAAFGCTPLVTGASLWQGEPFSAPPMSTTARGTAVPVWFVPAEIVNAAVADGLLTIGELSGLAGLVMGTADRFHETLHPVEGPHPQPLLVLGAHGRLEDGRRFSLQITSVSGALKSIRIELR
jgi:hypothetical protein